MRFLIPVILFCFSLIAMAETLTDYQWKNRLIVAFVQVDSEHARAFKQKVDALECQLDDRDLLVFIISDKQAHGVNKPAVSLDQQSVTRLISRRYEPDEPFEMLLIGKDGGIKARSGNTRQLQDFLALIDTMPMRRAESKERASGCEK